MLFLVRRASSDIHEQADRIKPSTIHKQDGKKKAGGEKAAG